MLHEATGDVVAMGRVIGDGGWYFHVVDMAVLPAHQRRGLGDRVLTALLDRIRAEAPPGAFVSLMADPPGRRLCARHGFTEDRDASIGWRCGWTGDAVRRAAGPKAARGTARRRTVRTVTSTPLGTGAGA